MHARWFRSSYSDGTSRPLFRGVLHTLVAITLAAYCFQGLAFWKSRVSLNVGSFLCGKLLSYGASALYHLCPVHEPVWECVLLKFDTVFITVAMWAPVNLFISKFSDWELFFECMLVATLLNLYTVQRQFAMPDAPSSSVPRVALLAGFGTSQILAIGYYAGFAPAWWVGSALYFASFLTAPPMYRCYPRSAPWHRPGLWSYHEDFHVLLLLADTSFVYLSQASYDA